MHRLHDSLMLDSRLLAVVLAAVACGGSEQLVLLPASDSALHAEVAPDARRPVASGRAIRRAGRAKASSSQSSDEKVVRIEDGVAIPVGNGKATITADGRMDKRRRRKSSVTDMDQPFQWSFRNHVESVLSKQGCNAGACHGARAGQKGFRLTLFGFDVDADYTYLTRQAVGRRIVPTDPGRSLILTKPTGLLPHKGGVRLEPGSLEYRVLAEWIASGVPGPKADDPQIERLEVLPKYSRQALEATQQLVVLAHFSDGHVEDATRWAKYTSVQQLGGVASMSAGKVKITGAGEAAIKVWYLNHNAMAYHDRAVCRTQCAPEVFANAPRRNFIDEHVLAKLQALRVPPSPRCDDATFLRRAYLDTIGTLPTADEARAFLADPSADKRDRLIDRCSRGRSSSITGPTNGPTCCCSPASGCGPRRWRRTTSGFARASPRTSRGTSSSARSSPPRGSTHENGAANFYALHQDPEDMAETVAQAFMGLSINCAKCHNHPLEKWTNDQYYALRQYVLARAGQGLGRRLSQRRRAADRLFRHAGRADSAQPRQAAAAARRSTASRCRSRRPTTAALAVAEWLTSPENPYFTRAIANRVWANFFGVGLVEAVDDLRLTNPASNEELLAAAAQVSGRAASTTSRS